jgi:hypothetical protein
MVNSNEKGARFERKTCVALSLWVSNDTRDDLFWRSAMSGGRATLASRVGRRPRKAQCGDISSLDEWGRPFLDRYFLECKFYEDLRMYSAFWDTEGLLQELWDKPLAEALAHDKTPLTIAKQNRKPELVFGTAATFKQFADASMGTPLDLQATFLRGGQMVHVWHFHQVITRCSPSLLLGRHQRPREGL